MNKYDTLTKEEKDAVLAVEKTGKNIILLTKSFQNDKLELNTFGIYLINPSNIFNISNTQYIGIEKDIYDYSSLNTILGNIARYGYDFNGLLALYCSDADVILTTRYGDRLRNNRDKLISTNLIDRIIYFIKSRIEIIEHENNFTTTINRGFCLSAIYSCDLLIHIMNNEDIDICNYNKSISIEMEELCSDKSKLLYYLNAKMCRIMNMKNKFKQNHTEFRDEYLDQLISNIYNSYIKSRNTIFFRENYAVIQIPSFNSETKTREMVKIKIDIDDVPKISSFKWSLKHHGNDTPMAYNKPLEVRLNRLIMGVDKLNKYNYIRFKSNDIYDYRKSNLIVVNNSNGIASSRQNVIEFDPFDKDIMYIILKSKVHGRIKIKLDRKLYDKVSKYYWLLNIRRTSINLYTKQYIEGKSIPISKFILGLENRNDVICINHINGDNKDFTKNNLHAVLKKGN